jgi:hypothetical protein
MSDALPLPSRPNIEQYKKLAKDLQHACQSSDPGAIRNWAARWLETIARLQRLRITCQVRRRTAAKRCSVSVWQRHFLRQSTANVSLGNSGACCAVLLVL